MLKKIADSALLHHWLDRKTGILTLPIDPGAVAESVGLRVVPLPDEKQFLSGELQEDTIFFNPTDSEPRQRFAVAHELGHYMLQHGQYFTDTAIDLSFRTFELKEAEANKFAAELLMPSVAVRHFVLSKGITNAQLLADRFGVSLGTLKYRLENLGLI